MTSMSISAPFSGGCTPGFASLSSSSLSDRFGSTYGLLRSVPSSVPGCSATAMASFEPLPLLADVPPAPVARWSSRLSVLTSWFVAAFDCGGDESSGQHVDRMQY